jgi:hypothetical protein
MHLRDRVIRMTTDDGTRSSLNGMGSHSASELMEMFEHSNDFLTVISMDFSVSTVSILCPEVMILDDQTLLHSSYMRSKRATSLLMQWKTFALAIDVL